jgi:hypothetical protein
MTGLHNIYNLAKENMSGFKKTHLVEAHKDLSEKDADDTFSVILSHFPLFSY